MRALGPHLNRQVAVMFAAASLIVLSGCAAEGTALRMTGRVSDDSIDVQVPAVVQPTPDTAISRSSDKPSGGSATGVGGGPSTAGAGRSKSSTAAALTQAGTFAVIESVEVSVGDQVRAGDVLVRLDSEALQANVVAARASARLSRARVSVLESLAEDLADKKVTIADARAEIVDTIGQLESTLADLREKRAEAARALAQLRRMLASLPTMPPGGMQPGQTPTQTPPGGIPPTGTPPGGVPTSTPPGGFPGGLTPGGPRPVLPDPAEIERGIAQLDAAIAKLESGLNRARGGLTRLDAATAQLDDARATLDDATDLARIAADASGLSVRLARQQLEAAVVRAPVAGVVTQVVSQGEVLAPGATAARIQPNAAASVNGWLGFENASRVAVGDRVYVTLDSRPGERYPARLTRIGTEAVYPPTYAATREVHLGRAVYVEARLEDADVALPAGTPCDITVIGAPPARQ